MTHDPMTNVPATGEAVPDPGAEIAGSPIPDPAVRVAGAREIAPGLLVIPDHRAGLVPNIGVIGGAEAVLVVETGIGVANAEQVLAFAAEVAKGRRLYLTTTHFHPEHAGGAQVFAGEATYLVNRAQADDLRTKGPGYLEMFRGFGGPIARRLDGVHVPTPDVVYDDGYDLDLGGRTVRLRPTGRGHTKGDQVIEVPDAGVLFTGDLAETGRFAIFPWFPPHDTDVSGVRWLSVMDRLAASAPRVVVPGHGDVGGPEILTTVRDYLRELRDETWLRRDSAMAVTEIAAEVHALLLERHPDWTGQEWITPSIHCLCAEHAA
ncbi:MBL fold metallo-hydrolase [Sphaerisporangium krabiense]|uniref:Glyoxylase-like metal-dependent hydrolase (Beta-lactamase superfamily II) n=1 Tax=Sphaerisporangium krabiense TaxID=763782 RepID=A0A7W8Z994_9ACTN|nr:MBL fold metallo-hydrolase [Sphaerisporangium krabiense]MBB5629779.1 glyoxylase-like metal-dependent hydrolase (beta-lactamase superfamily II) [Sphaerisporangium krabiense]GII63878.1 MBL fold metallo-hydrolase [Sphaerisporangium krabiense]